MLLVLMMVGLVACGGGSLPQEAIDKLHEEMRGDRGMGPTSGSAFSFSIVSAQKVADEYNRGYDEMWCVVIDPPAIGGVYNESYPGFVVYQRALLWSVDTRASSQGYIYGHDEESFLALGCTNFPK